MEYCWNAQNALSPCIKPFLCIALKWVFTFFWPPDGKQSRYHFWQRWNGEFFNKDSLQNHGHRYQLGHSGGRCPCPRPGPKNFTVFNVSGPHSVAIDYCQCSDQPLNMWNQLLRERWFPATLARPQTVFTFDCLETFHELTLQGKTSLYDYYHTLLRRSDNANLGNSIVSVILFSSAFTNS